MTTSSAGGGGSASSSWRAQFGCLFGLHQLLLVYSRAHTADDTVDSALACLCSSSDDRGLIDLTTRTPTQAQTHTRTRAEAQRPGLKSVKEGKEGTGKRRGLHADHDHKLLTCHSTGEDQLQSHASHTDTAAVTGASPLAKSLMASATSALMHPHLHVRCVLA